jgi:hypothetical protein
MNSIDAGGRASDLSTRRSVLKTTERNKLAMENPEKKTPEIPFPTVKNGDFWLCATLFSAGIVKVLREVSRSELVGRCSWDSQIVVASRRRSTFATLTDKSHLQVVLGTSCDRRRGRGEQ